MTEIKGDLNGHFCPSSDNGLPLDILGELESMLRLHSISPQELFYKWESYSLKMGSEETKLDLDTVRMFKKDVQDGLEREHRGKPTNRTDRRNPVAATPRGAVTGDLFGMYLRSIHPEKMPPLTEFSGSTRSPRISLPAKWQSMVVAENEKEILIARRQQK